MIHGSTGLRRSLSVYRCLRRPEPVHELARYHTARAYGDDELSFEQRPSKLRGIQGVDGFQYKQRQSKGVLKKDTSRRPRSLKPQIPIEKNLPYYKFDDLLRRRLIYLQYGSSRFNDIVNELGLSTRLKALIAAFTKRVRAQPASTYAGLSLSGKVATGWQETSEIPTLSALKTAYETQGFTGMEDLLINKFGLFASMSMLSEADMETQRKLANMSRPAEWFPLARSIPRKLHLHVGPTNSGKTYNALQRLQKAKSGCFAGPLRLLALEIYDRFNKAGVPCNLQTGEERRFEDGVMLTSSTIEMLSMTKEIDVLVIDEIQMIADPDRGNAWTNALLGCPAKEIHMCGEASVVDLVQKIAESLGETVEIHRYERLGGLVPLEKSLGGTFNAIEAGDAVVTFSRQNIFNVKKSIEEATGKKCAVVYGALPPETRSTQARLFNDPDSGFDVMVASDAIGMGLNLSIKRVVFETLEKWNGKEIVTLPIPQIKQIAGRAGRFKPRAKVEVIDADPPKDVPGYVTTLRETDMSTLHEALATPTMQLQKAMIKPPIELVEAFARPYPAKIRMSMITQQLMAFSNTSDLYKLSDLTQGNPICDLLHPVQGLSFQDRWALIDAPSKIRDPICTASFLEMATVLGRGRKADLLDLKEIDIDLLDNTVPESQESLQKLESLHHNLTLYLWLSIRFPGVFVSIIEVFQLRQATEELIEDALELLKAKRQANAGKQPFINQQMLFDIRRRRAEQASEGRRPRRERVFRETTDDKR